MTLDLFRFTVLARWLKDLLSPPPKTHPPGRASGAVSNSGAVPVEFD